MLAYILAIAVGLASLSLYLSAFFLPELHRKDDFLWSGVGLFYALVLWICAGRITGGVLLGQSAAVTLVLCFGWQTLRLRRAIAYPDEKTDIRGFSFVNWLQKRFKKPSTPVTPPISDTPEAENVTGETETTEEETEITSEVETPEATEVTAETETTEEETEITSEVETPETTEVTAETETTEEETEITSEVETPEPTEVTAETETTEEETEITSEVETPEPTEVTAETETTEEETEITSEVETQPEEKESEATSTNTETPETKKQGFSLKSIFGLGKSQSQPTSEPANDDLKESNWDDEDEEEVPPSVVAEIEAIESETVAETTEVKQEESTTKETPQMTESLEEYVAEFEPYMADDDAETIIEDYKPTSKTSESEIPGKDEDQPLETENNEKTDQNEEEKKSS